MKKVLNARLFIGIVIILCLVSQASAEENPSSTLVDRQKYEWVLEEILQQLIVLREEVQDVKSNVGALRSDVRALNDNVAKAKPTVAANPAPAAGPGAPSRVKLGSHRLGDSEARYAIVEFSDYQCPFCSRHAKQVLPQIISDLVDTGKVLYFLRDYPLSFHGEAKSAAIAARCAGAQDSYWEMHDKLFENHRNLSWEFYNESAQTIALNRQEFSKCIIDPAISEAVEADIDYASSLGVTGTPKFFVGKLQGDEISDVIVISGAQSFAAFSGAVERLGN